VSVLDFDYSALPVRVVFGLGVAIVSGPGEPLARRLVAPSTKRVAGAFTGVRPSVAPG
jgi:hypothetical protein